MVGVSAGRDARRNDYGGGVHSHGRPLEAKRADQSAADAYASVIRGSVGRADSGARIRNTDSSDAPGCYGRRVVHAAAAAFRTCAEADNIVRSTGRVRADSN